MAVDRCGEGHDAVRSCPLRAAYGADPGSLQLCRLWFCGCGRAFIPGERLVLGNSNGNRQPDYLLIRLSAGYLACRPDGAGFWGRQGSGPFGPAGSLRLYAGLAGGYVLSPADGTAARGTGVVRRVSFLSWHPGFDADAG